MVEMMKACGVLVGGKGNAAVGSFTTIVHEAGHAVETKALRDAQFATFQAQAVVNNDTIDFTRVIADQFTEKFTATRAK